MADDLRARLVEAGVELVAREGTEALSLREIARRAGVSHGAPRRYFPTHRELLAAVARVALFAEGGDVVGQPVVADPGHGGQQLAVGGEVAPGSAVGDAGAAGDLAQTQRVGALGGDQLDAGGDEMRAQVIRHRHCLPDAVDSVYQARR